jgi:hypothetical protein
MVIEVSLTPARFYKSLDRSLKSTSAERAGASASIVQRQAADEFTGY